MSRYVWRKKFDGEDNEKEILVGWDRPMNTFFAQIARLDLPEESEEDHIVFWIGGTFHEHQEISDFIEECPFEIAPELRRRLELDQQGKLDEAAAVKLPEHIRPD